MIATLRPLDGALEFLETLRARTQVIILSDTFYQFAEPLMRQLRWPTLFRNELVVDPSGRVEIDARAFLVGFAEAERHWSQF